MDKIAEIFRDTRIVKQYVDAARSEFGGKKTTDIFLNFLKVAQSIGGEFEAKRIGQKIDDLSNIIKEILSDRFKDIEDKKREIAKILIGNENIKLYLYSTSPNSDVYNRALELFVSENSITPVLNKTLSFNGSDAQSFDLKSLLRGSLASAAKIVQQLKSKQQDNINFDESLGTGKSNNLADQDKTYQDMLELKGDDSENPLDKFKKLGEFLLTILRDENQSVSGYYVRNFIKPIYKSFQDRLKNSGSLSNEEKRQLIVDVALFNQQTYDFLANKIATKKRRTNFGVTSEYTGADLQEQLNIFLDKVDLDSLVENIINSGYYRPQFIKKMVTAGQLPALKALLKGLIKSEIILDARTRLLVPMTGKHLGYDDNGNLVFNPKGYKFNESEFLIDFIRNEIKHISRDSQEQSKMMSHIEDIMGIQKIPNSDEYLYPERSSILRGFANHQPNLIKSGLLHGIKQQSNEDFSNISPESREEIVQNISDKIYPYVPMSISQIARDPKKATQYDKHYHESYENSNELAARHLHNLLHAALRAERGEIKPHNVFHPESHLELSPLSEIGPQSVPLPGKDRMKVQLNLAQSNDPPKDLQASGLSVLIQKYAQNRSKIHSV